MMPICKYVAFICLVMLSILSCRESSYRFQLNTTQKTNLGDEATIKFEQLRGNVIDSVHLYVNHTRVNKKETNVTLNTTDLGVGKHTVTAIAFYPNASKKLNNAIEVFANKAPELYTFKITNTYPHDTKAYTQGLEYYKGFLYETTGKRGQSTLRKVAIETGEVLQKIALENQYFGEGMTIYKDTIYWLTWQSRKGFMYSLDTFEKIGDFNYNNSHEGWGLTHSQTELIKSDGTHKIWFLNPKDLTEKRSIQVYTNKLSLEKLNELELIKGKIYANYWQKPLIAIINPENGTVEGIINLTNLVKEMKKNQQLVNEDNVLNGIAFDPKNNRIFVTGKRWSKLFEIELIKQ